MANIYSLNGQQVYDTTDAAGNKSTINAQTGQAVTTSQAATSPSAPISPSQPVPSPQQVNPAVTTGSPQQTGSQAQKAATVQPSAPQGQMPQVQVNVGQPQQQSTQTQQVQAPTTNLQPGSQGQDVQQLQNYLVQQGYPIDFSNGGQGVYGPQTTAAVSKMQQDLGIQAGANQGYYGPQTQQALEQKYQGIYNQMSGAAPDQGGAARNAILGAQNASTDSSNPVFGAMAASMAPIMQSLTQVLNNINNPALGAVSLQQEYNDLSSQYNIPGLQSQMMNLQNIMNGTTDDIRQEITTAGGGGTESQIQAMSAARNNVILKQYNSLATQYTAAQTNVQNMMQYAQQDQQANLSRQQLTASVTENLASVENQMMQMGMTMQNNARSAVQYNVTQMGYQGLAQSTNGDPQMLSYYENMLALPPGSLSDPSTVQSMDTYKNQQLQLNNYKAAISAFQAGYGNGMMGGAGASTPGAPVQGQVGVNPVDPSTLNRPPWLSGITTINGKSVDLSQVPLTVSAQGMEQYMSTNKAASVDGNTNNIVAPGIGYYVHQADGSYVLNSALPSPIDNQYNQIKQTMDSAGVFQGSPTITRKWTLSANSAISSFKDTGTYKVASNVAPYLAAIHAAAVNPGDKSISDFELLDSFVKAAKGGAGQVTDSQIGIMLHGASLNDTYQNLEQKLQNGGVLAPAQRTALVNLADQTYTENLADYQKGYVQAVQAMQAQGIPPQFWRNLPDFTSLTPQ